LEKLNILIIRGIRRFCVPDVGEAGQLGGWAAEQLSRCADAQMGRWAVGQLLAPEYYRRVKGGNKEQTQRPN
jgi:hypothetical protein